SPLQRDALVASGGRFSHNLAHTQLVCRAVVEQGLRVKEPKCGLTLRCTRPATAGFARFRRRVNSNVGRHEGTLVIACCAPVGQLRIHWRPARVLRQWVPARSRCSLSTQVECAHRASFLFGPRACASGTRRTVFHRTSRESSHYAGPVRGRATTGHTIVGAFRTG